MDSLYPAHNSSAFGNTLSPDRQKNVPMFDISTDKKEVALFFISSQIQGKGYGQKALRMIEESYPEVTTWRLVTPTQVIRNAVFYINKCGYSIVSVVDWDKENECGMFVFEKKCGRDRND